MLKVILERILVELDDLKREHDLGNGVKLEIAYGELEKRVAAGVTNGVVVAVGPDAFSDRGYVSMESKPVQVGDRVQFAKYAGAAVFDESMPTKRLAVINDEDVLAIIKSKESTNE